MKSSKDQPRDMLKSLKQIKNKRSSKESPFMGALTEEAWGKKWSADYPSGKAQKASGGRLPSWGDLTNRGSRAVPEETPKTKEAPATRNYRTLRIGAVILAGALLGLLYVRHVNDTQTILGHVQQLRKENIRLQLQNNRLKNQFDQITDPGKLVSSAKDLGLVEGYTYAQDIKIKAIK